MKTSKQKNAQTFYEQIRIFESHCKNKQEGNGQYTLVFKSIIDSYNQLIDGNIKLLKKPLLETYKISSIHLKFTTSGSDYVFPGDFLIQIELLKTFLETNFGVIKFQELDLIHDEQLKLRCLPLFLNEKIEHDTIVREVTTIFEDRLRNAAGLLFCKNTIGRKLVKKVFRENGGILVSKNGSNETDGLFYLCMAIFTLVRNKSHHVIVGDIEKQELFKIIIEIDKALELVNNLIKK